MKKCISTNEGKKYTLKIMSVSFINSPCTENIWMSEVVKLVLSSKIPRSY